MKILIFGANGFIGRAVAAELGGTHQVILAIRAEPSGSNEVQVDLENKAVVTDVIRQVEPDVLVNCAGVVDVANDVSLNQVFTENIVSGALHSDLMLHRIIVMGSAAEYGVVDNSHVAVQETAPLNATSAYAISKVKETTTALRYKKDHQLPVVVARVFNPIGGQMQSKFLISRIIKQLDEFKQGSRIAIEISRLDALRDYVSVNDVATAIRAIIEGRPKHDIYNIGSGIATSNGELVELILKHSKILKRPKITETSPEKEPSYAARADITRMKDDFGWSPKVTLEDSVKDILNATKNQ